MSLRAIVCCFVVIAIGGTFPGGTARAELCAVDPVRGATLLLPYFEVDLGKLRNPSRGETTTLYLHSSTAAPQVVRVTLWTDLSVPTLSFTVALEGFDVETIPLHDIFNGDFPQEFDDECRPLGVIGEELRNAHTGQPVDGFAGRCAAQEFGDNLARGYVTLDNVDSCPTVLPNDPSYYNSLSNENELFGDYVIDFRKKKYATVENLVAIEAGRGGSNTFYGRYSGGSDRREPLGAAWGARYAAVSGSKTFLIIWRDSGAVQEPFTCSQLGSQGWYPLGHTQIVAFDEDADFTEISDDPDIIFAPAEANKIQIGVGDAAVPYRRGWIFANLNPGQSHVTVRQDVTSGRRRGRHQPTLFGHACDAPPAEADPIP